MLWDNESQILENHEFDLARYYIHKKIEMIDSIFDKHNHV